MSKDFWFWGIIAIWVFFRFAGYRKDAARRVWWFWGGDLISLILFIIIGLSIFKEPLSTMVK